MRLNAVESSVISQVGYEPDLQHLRVIMNDGATFDVAPVFASEYAEFMAAPSKGIHWFRVFAARGYKSSEGKESANSLKRSSPGSAPVVSMREPEPGQPLDTFEPDKCCGGPLQKAALSGVLKSITSWECPKCGCEWRPDGTGPIRHWSPYPAIMVLRA